MRGVGEVSYSMYLIHFAILPLALLVAERLLPGSNWGTLALHFCLTTTITYLLALLTYRFVERPFIRWAHQLTRRGSPAADGRALAATADAASPVAAEDRPNSLRTSARSGLSALGLKR